MHEEDCGRARLPGAQADEGQKQQGNAQRSTRSAAAGTAGTGRIAAEVLESQRNENRPGGEQQRHAPKR